MITLSSIVFQIGKTKVFLRAGQMAEIDARRNEVLGRSATVIQKQIRTFFFHRWFKQMRLSAIQIQALCRGMLCLIWLIELVGPLLLKFLDSFFSNMDGIKMRRLHYLMSAL